MSGESPGPAGTEKRRAKRQRSACPPDAEKQYPDATETMLCYTPGTSDVALVPHPDHTGESRHYRTCLLAAFGDVRRMTFEERKLQVFMEAMHAIVRDGVPAHAVHKALLGLREYRHGCSHDMPGLVR